MKVNLSPWVRDTLGPAAVQALREGPAGYELSVSKGKSGFGATLIRRTSIGYALVANVAGCATPADSIEAVMEVARPKPKAVTM